MKIFENFNEGTNCPICKTNKGGQAVLIPIDGTSDGSICEGQQVHLDCIDLRFKRIENSNIGIYYQISA